MNKPESVSFSGLLPIGKVIRPHGLKGLLRIVLYSGSEASLLDVGTVFIRAENGEIREYAVSSVKAHKNIFLMDVKALNSVNEAENYRDAEIFVKKESLTREEDAYFWYELLDLDVFLDTGEHVGSISRIIPTPSNDIYLVKQGKKEVYIPAVYDVVKEIDLKTRRMTISPMEGMLDLNEV